MFSYSFRSSNNLLGKYLDHRVLTAEGKATKTNLLSISLYLSLFVFCTGSWFASASRFVNETDTSKLSRQENLNAEQNKFQLQPSRLYPLLNVVQRGGPPTPQDKEHGKAVKQIQTSELRRRELLSDEASEKCRTDRDNIQRTSDRRSDYKGLLKSIIKLFFIFAVVFSVVLNICLLKIFTDRNRKNN